MNDDRRAEIDDDFVVFAAMNPQGAADAHARALAELSCERACRENWRERAEQAEAALDRVRAARGDDEAVTCECGKVCDSERHQLGHAVLSLQPDKHRLVAARSPQGEDHEAGIEAASLVMHTLSCECDTPARVQDCPYNGISEWEQRAVRSIVSAYLSRVTPSPQGDDHEADEKQEAR